MAETRPQEITADQLRGFKQLRRVAGLLSSLHDAGCARDKAGNRELHFDDYVLLILLYLFNPLIDSMRTLAKVADLPEVRQRLGVKRFSLGSFSESCRVFEPSRLQGVVEQLAGELRPLDRHELLGQLPGKLTLVDSTVIQTLCTVAEAMFLPLGDGRHSHAWRLHLHLDVDHHVPAAWQITEPLNSGKTIGLTGAVTGKKATWSNVYYAGPENTNTNKGWRHLYDTNLLLTPKDQFNAYINFDYGSNHDPVGSGKSTWKGIAAAAKIAPNGTFALIPRIEWFDDTNGFSTGTKQAVKEFTITAELKMKEGMFTRFEYRHDWSDVKFFERGAAGTTDHQDTLLVGFVAFFGPKR